MVEMLREARGSGIVSSNAVERRWNLYWHLEVIEFPSPEYLCIGELF